MINEDYYSPSSIIGSWLASKYSCGTVTKLIISHCFSCDYGVWGGEGGGMGKVQKGENGQERMGERGWVGNGMEKMGRRG